MRITNTLTNAEISLEVGERLRGYRLQQNRTLDEVARAAGVSLRTARRAEAGDRPSLTTVVQLLRALGRLESLDAFLPAPTVSPIQMARMGGKVRQRARGPSRQLDAPAHRPGRQNEPGDLMPPDSSG